MQNCPLKATQIAPVMVLNAQNCKIYRAVPRTLPEGGSQQPPGQPAARVLLLHMSAFVTKLNLYPENSHC